MSHRLEPNCWNLYSLVAKSLQWLLMQRVWKAFAANMFELTSAKLLQVLPPRLRSTARALPPELFSEAGLSFDYTDSAHFDELVQALAPEDLVTVYGDGGWTFKPSARIDTDDYLHNVWPIAPYLAEPQAAHTLKLRWWTSCSQGTPVAVHLHGVPSSEAQPVLSRFKGPAVASADRQYLELPFTPVKARPGVLELWSASLNNALSSTIPDRGLRHRIRHVLHTLLVSHLKLSSALQVIDLTTAKDQLKTVFADAPYGCLPSINELLEYVPSIAEGFDLEGAEAEHALKSLLMKGRLPVSSLREGSPAFLMTLRQHLEQYVAQTCSGLAVRIAEYEVRPGTNSASVTFYQASGAVAIRGRVVEFDIATDSTLLIQDIGVGYQA